MPTFRYLMVGVLPLEGEIMDPPCRVKSHDIRSCADTIVVFQNIHMIIMNTKSKENNMEKPDISAFTLNSFVYLTMCLCLHTLLNYLNRYMLL